jgi:hypothetical protein
VKDASGGSSPIPSWRLTLCAHHEGRFQRCKSVLPAINQQHNTHKLDKQTFLALQMHASIIWGPEPARRPTELCVGLFTDCIPKVDTRVKITVGHPTRARNIAKNFDGGLASTFSLESDRGFLTITGRYNGVPVSVISIGMGFANMDFMVREARECVEGEMAIVRFAP